MTRLSPDHRRALEMLAGRSQCSEALLLAHGFSPDLLAELIFDGLASASIGRMRAGGRIVEVRQLRITGIGRGALEL
jgi:hypothetical protein